MSLSPVRLRRIGASLAALQTFVLALYESQDMDVPPELEQWINPGDVDDLAEWANQIAGDNVKMLGDAMAAAAKDPDEGDTP